MLCPLLAHRILDGILVDLKALRSQIAQMLNIHHLPEFLQRLLTLAAPFIVLGIRQLVLFIGIADHNLRVFQLQRDILICQIRGMEKNRVILFPHGNRKLIHNPAVHPAVIILRILPVDGQHLVAHLKTIEIPQGKSRQNLQRRGRGKPGAVGKIAVDSHVKTGFHRVPFLDKGIHNSLRVVGPAESVVRLQFVQ